MFIEASYQKAFKVLGRVLINGQVVLDRLEVRLRTPITGNPLTIKDTKQYTRVWIPIKARK
jgi:hypothetical protein